MGTGGWEGSDCLRWERGAGELTEQDGGWDGGVLQVQLISHRLAQDTASCWRFLKAKCGAVV